MNIDEANQLIQKYYAGKCTEAEKVLVENSLLAYNEHEIELSQERIDEIAAEVYAKLPIHRARKLKVFIWSSAAAALIISILAIAHWRLEENLNLFAQTKEIQDIAPIGNRAILTVGGKMVSLNADKGGLVVSDGVVKYLDGSQVENDLIPQMSQTLSTPKGGQFKVVLQDGTKVWLNAASSISYPSSFVGAKERRVTVTGEAYFEVAKDKIKAFLVSTPTQLIKVLGTHFNVNAYGDNGMAATTLLEGSVSVSSIKTSDVKVLKPLQTLVTGSGVSQIKPADVEVTMAWKNGMLEFRDASLKSILKEVARWYDLDVEYRGEVPDRVFNGSVSRHSNLSVLLKILSYSDIKFRIETDGSPTKKLIVEP
ncbi:FecR family protein [Pedobacter helvus]|uniref:FecR family protein n=1 Tax=Pedobacter helvus TaxID=2563444 RepID=A0ABW9JRB5_9SPHI|nr:FecR family protein [Pedobacter ureilyticus]